MRFEIGNWVAALLLICVPANSLPQSLEADSAIDPQGALVETQRQLANAGSSGERAGLLAQEAFLLAQLDRLEDAEAAISQGKSLLAPTDNGARADLLFVESNLLALRQQNVRAEELVREARAIQVNLHGEDSLEVAANDIQLGKLLISQSKLEDGIAVVRRGWRVYDRLSPAGSSDRMDAGFQLAVGLVYSRQASEAEAFLRKLYEDLPLLPERQPYRAKLPNMLGTELLMQGRVNEAIPLLREAVDTGQRIGTQILGERADNLATLGVALLMQDRPNDALPYLERSAVMFGEAGAIPSQAGSYINAGTAADRAGDRARGLQLREQGMALLATLPEQHELAVALNRFKLAQSYAHAGRLDEAETMAAQAADVIGRLRPTSHFQNTNSRISQGWIMALNGRTDQGLTLVKDAFRASVDANNQLEVAQNQVVGVLDNIEAYSQALQTAVLARDRDFAFEVIQVLIETDASRAAVAVTTRETAEDSALGSLLRRRQEAMQAIGEADGSLLEAIAGEGDKQSAEKALAASRAELAAIDDRLDAQFPGFRELLRPRPVSLAQAHSALSGTDVLLVIEESDLGVYTMAITSGDVAIGHAAIRRQELRTLVQRIRTGIARGGSGDFDLDASSQLFDAIFTTDVRSLIAPGSRLHIVTGDILSALPLSLLASQGGKTVEDTRWLIEDHALSVLPSLATLVHGKEPMRRGGRLVAIGAPALSGKMEVTAGPEFFAGGETRAARVSRLQPLPGARDEIEEVARLLKSDGPAPTLLTGSQATEAAVRELDLKGVSVLLFATHGLVAGAFDAQSEPALVLSPPVTSDGPENSANDGLLTASEAAHLDIDADWAILSACDTAAGNYPSAAGYTGLARAFLFAGAHRVVASHWPVRDDIAARLSAGIVSAYRGGAAPGDALRSSVLALMRDKSLKDSRNPAVWAPFMVVAR